MLLHYWIFLITFSTFSSIAFGEIFTFRAPETKGDLRYNYDNAILKLALEKTIPTHGKFEFKASPRMNFAKTKKVLKKNKLPNFFAKQSYSQEWDKDMILVPFPVDLGIVGYRVCFLSSQLKEEFSKVQSLSDLKKYVHGQGKGWGDVKILRSHNFKVVERPKYKSLFELTAKRRGFDIFCRGANELAGEWKNFSKIKNLAYDESIALVYPLPRFFFTSKSNKKAADRVLAGLKMAYEDGSLQELWKKNYAESINFVRLDKRKIFRIDNPNLAGLDKSFEKYFYNPLAH